MWLQGEAAQWQAFDLARQLEGYIKLVGQSQVDSAMRKSVFGFDPNGGNFDDRFGEEIVETGDTFFGDDIAGQDAVESEIGNVWALFFHREPHEMVELAVGSAAQLGAATGGGKAVVFLAVAIVLHVVMGVPGEAGVGASAEHFGEFGPARPVGFAGCLFAFRLGPKRFVEKEERPPRIFVLLQVVANPASCFLLKLDRGSSEERQTK